MLDDLLRKLRQDRGDDRTHPVYRFRVPSFRAASWRPRALPRCHLGKGSRRIGQLFSTRSSSVPTRNDRVHAALFNCHERIGRVELAIDVVGQLFAQLFYVNIAGQENGCGILIFGEGEQEMF